MDKEILMIRVSECFIENMYSKKSNWRTRTWDYNLRNAEEAEQKFRELGGYKNDSNSPVNVSIEFIFKEQ
jgi:hypothetical protein